MNKLQKSEPVKKYLLPIEIQREGNYYLANCPLWPDCYAQGDSIDQATSEIISVASALVDLYEEESLRIPLHRQAEISASQGHKIAFDVPVFTNLA